MDAPTCQTCIHWVPWEEIDSGEMAGPDMPSPPHGDERTKVDDPQVWGTCGLIVHPKEADRVKGLPAFTMDSSDYWGRLSCREDFGCLLHDPAVVSMPAPEYPGGTTTEEGQPRAMPHPQIQGDPEDEETVAIMTAASPDPIAIRKVRPAPRIKDPSRQTRPRLPDGLGQASAVEGPR